MINNKDIVKSKNNKKMYETGSVIHSTNSASFSKWGYVVVLDFVPARNKWTDDQYQCYSQTQEKTVYFKAWIINMFFKEVV